MKLPDVNILLYAHNLDSSFYKKARTWLEDALSDTTDPLALSTPVILAFMRVGCNPTVNRKPLMISEASRAVASWLNGGAILLDAEPDVFALAAKLIEEVGGGSNLVTDAFLAALAITHRATVFSTDRDFLRFPGLKVKNPLSA